MISFYLWSISNRFLFWLVRHMRWIRRKLRVPLCSLIHIWCTFVDVYRIVTNWKPLFCGELIWDRHSIGNCAWQVRCRHSFIEVLIFNLFKMVFRVPSAVDRLEWHDDWAYVYTWWYLFRKVVSFMCRFAFWFCI